MSRQVQLRRGTAVQHQTFTGLVGELTMNTTNNSLRLHDNVLNGGHEMLKADMSNVLISSDGTFSLLDSLGQVSVRITNVADPVDNQDVATKSWVLANIGNNVGNFTFNNGDLKALQEIQEKWRFKDKSSLIKFAMAVLLRADDNKIKISVSGSETEVEPKADLLNPKTDDGKEG